MAIVDDDRSQYGNRGCGLETGHATGGRPPDMASSDERLTLDHASASAGDPHHAAMVHDRAGG